MWYVKLCFRIKAKMKHVHIYIQFNRHRSYYLLYHGQVRKQKKIGYAAPTFRSEIELEVYHQQI